MASYNKQSTDLAYQRLACLIPLGYDATGIAFSLEDTTAQVMRETDEGKMIIRILDDAVPRPTALDIEMVLGFNGETVAMNCGKIVTQCYRCERRVWPWQLLKYDEDAETCPLPLCRRKHNRFACSTCFPEAFKRVQDRETRHAMRRMRRQARLNRLGDSYCDDEL